MLELMMNRLEDSPIPTVIATSIEASDDPVAELAESLDFPVVRGSLENVLERFLDVLELYPADVIVRMTGDNPFSDGAGVEAALEHFERREAWTRGISNHLADRLDPHGYAFEVVESDALREIHRSGPSADEREHVTFGLRSRGTYGSYSIAQEDLSQMRWTVDYDSDYRYMCRLFEDLGTDADFESAVEWSREHIHPGVPK